ncbi:MAG TPA: hypothetical protein VGR64_02245 [Terracidiphilus sp.]|nr:hypothetical protein [Terracidiphilus sp.]
MKKKTPARPAAKKHAAPKNARSRKLAAKPAAPRPRKAAPAAPAEARAKPVAAKPVEPAAQTVPLPLHAEPHKPGLHLPMRPAPAYAQMIQRAWAGKPPPHKLTK